MDCFVINLLAGKLINLDREIGLAASVVVMQRSTVSACKEEVRWCGADGDAAAWIGLPAEPWV